MGRAPSGRHTRGLSRDDIWGASSGRPAPQANTTRALAQGMDRILPDALRQVEHRAAGQCASGFRSGLLREQFNQFLADLRWFGFQNLDERGDGFGLLVVLFLGENVHQFRVPPGKLRHRFGKTRRT